MVIATIVRGDGITGVDRHVRSHAGIFRQPCRYLEELVEWWPTSRSSTSACLPDNQAVGIDMKVAVVGLSYLGSVTAACLAINSNGVWGVDVDAAKVDDIMADRTPVAELGAGVRIAEALKYTYNTFHATKVSFANEYRGRSGSWAAP
jgi:hypothetical protein